MSVSDTAELPIRSRADAPGRDGRNHDVQELGRLFAGRQYMTDELQARCALLGGMSPIFTGDVPSTAKNLRSATATRPRWTSSASRPGFLE